MVTIVPVGTTHRDVKSAEKGFWSDGIWEAGPVMSHKRNMWLAAQAHFPVTPCFAHNWLSGSDRLDAVHG